MKMYIYNCKAIKVVDGDTVDAKIDLGFNISINKRIRLYGINAPESRTRDLAEKELGLASKQYLIDSLIRGDFVLQSKKDSTGKYGRLLGEIIVDDVNINERMLELGYAKEYMRD